MKVELLYFDGCPSYETTYENVKAVLREERIEAEVEWVKVESAGEAERRRFLGSPTLRIDGADVEPSARSDTSYGLRCRVYAIDGDLVGSPSREMIREALRAARL